MKSETPDVGAAGAIAYAFIVVAVLVFVTNRGRGLGSPIEYDEEVAFFPTFGRLSPDGTTWVIEVHGWIYEPEEDSRLRNAGLDALRRFLGLEKGEAKSAIFQKRARAFLVDNERGKRIAVRLGDKRYPAGLSGPNGHFQGVLHLPVGDAESLGTGRRGKDGWILFEAVTRKEDPRTFAGRVQLIDETGLSVITDVDDTIKISDVAHHRTLLRNTFLRDFQAVPGMAKLYRSWAATGARFHYVSASPWQLHQPLSAFLRTAGFPEGTFHLKYFRWKDSTALELFASPETLKRETIESILAAFPHREFILVGDSGEKDPEVYGALAREHPERMARILIRDVTGQGAGCRRYQEAFAGVAEDRWMIFRHAEEIEIRAP